MACVSTTHCLIRQRDILCQVHSAEGFPKIQSWQGGVGCCPDHQIAVDLNMTKGRKDRVIKPAAVQKKLARQQLHKRSV